MNFQIGSLFARNKNPIKKLKAWHDSKVAETETPKEKPPAPPTYKDAVASFDRDVADLQARDLSSSSTPSRRPHNHLRSALDEPVDTDMRPGEVDVPGVGSLHSTPEGFSLKLIKDATTTFDRARGVREFKPRVKNFYTVDHSKGTIAVGNDQGANPGLGISEKKGPGFRESYTIDTEQGMILDYQKTVKNNNSNRWAGPPVQIPDNEPGAPKRAPASPVGPPRFAGTSVLSRSSLVGSSV